MRSVLKIGPIRQQVAIAGRVTDAETGRALGGVQVAISAGPPAFTAQLPLQAAQYGADWEMMSTRADRTRTAPDGHYHFTDLPAGQYTLTASQPGAGSRYGTADAKVRVASTRSRSDPDKIVAVTADIALSPTALKGQITSADAKQPLFLVEVAIRGSGERVFSDAQGNYRLTALEAGARTVLISARGYQAASNAVQFRSPGEAQRLDVALEPVR